MSVEIETQAQPDNTLLRLTGTLDADAATALMKQVRPHVRRVPRITLDLTAIAAADSFGLAALAECLMLASRFDCSLRVTGVSDALRREMEAVPAPEQPKEPERISRAERLGERALDIGSSLVAFLQLLADTTYWALIAPLRGRLPPPGSISQQAVHIGLNAAPIVCLIAFLLGLIMAFQAAYQLRQFGANIFVANLVGVAMVRELGPLMTAILIAGRSGSAIAAELGTMTVGEEIDALRTMGIDPIRFLVVPRVYAITFTQMALTMYAMSVGVFGGFLIAIFYLDLSPTAYIKQSIQALQLSDLIQGLSKSVCFSWVIVMVGCHYGMRITGGAAGVGRSTTNSVVTSIFAIIVVDSVFTTLSTILG